MRRISTLLYVAGLTLVGVLGCKHQPELKPPEHPEVLAAPVDKRYEDQPRYPASEMVSDPLKSKGSGDAFGGGKGSHAPGASMTGMPQ